MGLERGLIEYPMRRRILRTALRSVACVGLLSPLTPSAQAGRCDANFCETEEHCYPDFCVTNKVTRSGSNWDIHLAVRLTKYKLGSINVILMGGAQRELSSRGDVIPVDFSIVDGGTANYSIQSCTRKVDTFTPHNVCARWVALHAPIPYPCPDPYVWRESFDYDFKCVVARDKWRLENGQCRSGYVWIGVPPVPNQCVTPAERAAVTQKSEPVHKLRVRPLPGSDQAQGGGAKVATSVQATDVYPDNSGASNRICTMNPGDNGAFLESKPGEPDWVHLSGVSGACGGKGGWVWNGGSLRIE